MTGIHRIVVGSTLLAAAGGAQAALVDFNTPGDLTNNFFTEADDPIGEALVEADAVGVGGSRGVSILGSETVETPDTGPVYTGASLPFNTVGTSLAASIYFHTRSPVGTAPPWDTEARVLEVGFNSANDADVTGGHNGAGGKLQFFNSGGNDSAVDDVEIEFRRSNGDVGTSVSPTSFDIQSGRWYKATFTMTSQGAGQPIPATFVLDDYGTDGTALAQAGVFSHSFDIPAEDILTADGDVYGAFRVRNSARLFDAIDNFEIVLVPEPTSGIALAAVGMGLLARRRTRRAD